MSSDVLTTVFASAPRSAEVFGPGDTRTVFVLDARQAVGRLTGVDHLVVRAPPDEVAQGDLTGARDQLPDQNFNFAALRGGRDADTRNHVRIWNPLRDADHGTAFADALARSLADTVRLDSAPSNVVDVMIITYFKGVASVAAAYKRDRAYADAVRAQLAMAHAGIAATGRPLDAPAVHALVAAVAPLAVFLSHRGSDRKDKLCRDVHPGTAVGMLDHWIRRTRSAPPSAANCATYHASTRALSRVAAFCVRNGHESPVPVELVSKRGLLAGMWEWLVA